jgi:protein-L-isoaspartate(D-aspartate) O-methyltransferase
VSHDTGHDEAAQAEQMIRRQLKDRGIADPRVLAAFGRVDRALFVPVTERDRAYRDQPLPIGRGQTISQPYIVALMTEALAVEPTHRVLDVGTGSGYQAALLAQLAGEVHTVERIAALSDRAAAACRLAGIEGIRFHVGDGTLGWPPASPFDRILVAAAAPQVPPALVEQLAEDGRLVLPLGAREVQVLTLVRREGGRLERTSLCDCVFVPLIGREGWPERPT